jgi:hypothetical protein
MQFEIFLPKRLDVYTLFRAGINARPYSDLGMECIIGKVRFPFEVSCKYYLSDEEQTVYITRFEHPTSAHLIIKIENEQICSDVEKFLRRYDIEHNGEDVLNKERKESWEKVEEIVVCDGATPNQNSHSTHLLSRNAIIELMDLCSNTEKQFKPDIYDCFRAKTVSMKDRSFACKWLVEEFKNSWWPGEQLCINLWELAHPSISDELIELIQNPRYDFSRGILCLALAKTKDNRAPDAIACVMDDRKVSRGAIEALGKLKAIKYVEKIRRHLRSTDSDIRREAKKTLKKLGFPDEKAPEPVHLIKGHFSPPKGLAEWSTNLDIDDLSATLEKIQKIGCNGFGDKEIEEIVGVCEEMKESQTRSFRFPILAEGSPADFWISIFMDDIDSPDIYIYSTPDIIRRFSEIF